MNIFKILNKAVKDRNLSSTGFRVLYYLVNLTNIDKTDNVVLFNDQISEVIGINKRQITNITNELVENGYIVKETETNPKLRRPNKYIIVEHNYE